VTEHGLTTVRTTLSVGLSLIAVVVLAALPPAAPARGRSISFSFLLSKARDGGFPNGPSRNGVVSSDKRISRYMAYESDADNIVSGDTNGLTDVFAVRRDTHVSSFRSNGSPWVARRTFLASHGRGGRPANGRSYRPSLDGDSDENAHCLAFISEASNLVRGDTNGVADAFVEELSNRSIRRVSVSGSGKQANGPSSEVSIDGNCERVAFTSTATNLGGAVKASGPPARGSQNGASQVYVRYVDGRYKGHTILASASNSGKPGNADSSNPSFARKGNAVAFTSLASNLAGKDSNGVADVFLRQIHRFKANKAQPQFRLHTKLLSATSSGRSGNGPSREPSVDSKARYVAFESDASNLTGSGHTQIIRVDLQRGRRQVVSRNRDGSIGNADSHHAAITSIGFQVFFDSEASNFRPPGRARDANGNSDVFQWYELSGNTDLISRDYRNVFISAASQNPSTGLHGNYVPYESVDPRVDANTRSNAKASEIPTPIPPEIEPTPAQEPGTLSFLQQVYVHYGGPCARTERLPDGTLRCKLR
jgi:hypothetical protein